MVRTVLSAVLWIMTTVLLAAALPAQWAQQHLVDRAGYAELAQRAATDPNLQSAVATELTAQVGRLGAAADSTVVGAIARTYTASASFPGQFAEANAFAHRWLFTTSVDSSLDPQGRWVIDFAPMLSDSSFAQTLRAYNIALPSSVPIPLTDNAPAALRPGSLSEVAFWGPWAAWSLVILTVAGAVLTLMVARNRGKAVAALGGSAVLVGGAGWAAIELVQPRLQSALDGTSGTMRTVAESMVRTAEAGMHQWLNISLLVGGGLVLVGVLVSLLAGLR